MGRPAFRLFVLGLAAQLLGGCGSDAPAPMIYADAGADSSLPPVTIPNPVSVETMAPAELVAGAPLNVTCLILDESGEEYSAMGRNQVLRVAPEGSIVRNEDDSITVEVAGVIEVSCVFPELMLADPTPALVRVVPGSPAEVITTVSDNVVEAGQSIDATCEAFDAFGNRIVDAEPTLGVSPDVETTTTEGLSATITNAGPYNIACELGGASSAGQAVEVLPTVPATLSIARIPDEALYGIGQIIEISSQVTDRYDNVLPDADIRFESAPAGNTLGRNRFRYDNDGTYTITATIEPPTETGSALTASTTFVVDGNGPAITCDSPNDGSMIVATPGSTVTFQGSVSDVVGVDEVTVNGNPVTVTGGAFSAPIPVEFGINFVELTARDTAGTESSRTCAFLASPRYAAPTANLDGVLSLKLRQEAIDDSNATDGLDSLNDILLTVLNSSGLRNQLNATLQASNPLYPRRCVQSGPFGSCLFRLQADYRNNSLQIPGPNSSELRLVSGGFRTTVRIPRLEMGIQLGGTVSSRGTVTARDATIALTFNVRLNRGQPEITVRSVDTVSIRRMDTDFSGVAGFVIDILVDLFEGTVRRTIENQLRDYIRDSFDEVLEDVLGGLDVSTIGSTLNVPRLDGSGDIAMRFGVDFSSWSTTASRMLVGIGTNFSAPTAVGYPTEGVAYPSGAVLDDPSTSTSAAVSVHSALFNQVMHALWRGGLLETTVSGSSLGGSLPAGTTAELRGALPPVAHLVGDRVELGIGALSLSIVYPGFIDTPLSVTLGAKASTNVSLSGNDLSFGGIRIDELVFSTGDVSLDPGTRDVLEGFLRTLVQNIVDDVLNDALPALPIPSFELPDSMTAYGIPRGTELGLRSPTLSTEPQHFVLRSNFGSL